MKNNRGETAFSLYEKKISQMIRETDSEIVYEELQKLQKCQEILVKASSYPFLFQETITSFGYQSENSPSVLHRDPAIVILVTRQEVTLALILI